MLELFPPNYFHIKEFLIEPNKAVPIDIMEKIVRYHLIPLNPIRHELGLPISISQSSGYRSKHGRLSISAQAIANIHFKIWALLI